MDTTPDIDLDAQRHVIRESLNEIAADLGMAMRDEGLHFPGRELHCAVANAAPMSVAEVTSS